MDTVAVVVTRLKKSGRGDNLQEGDQGDRDVIKFVKGLEAGKFWDEKDKLRSQLKLI